jgi:hypothetical protein
MVFLYLIDKPSTMHIEIAGTTRFLARKSGVTKVLRRSTTIIGSVVIIFQKLYLESRIMVSMIKMNPRPKALLKYELNPIISKIWF